MTLSENPVTASAPGKVIISGEHAVVYGKPALAMATRCRASATIKPDYHHEIHFDVPNLDYKLSFSESELKGLYHTLTERYDAFLNGRCAVNEILDHPVDLIPFAFATAWRRGGWQPLGSCSVGLDIGIPVGCGMGSSAAVGLSVINAMMRYLGLAISEDEQYEDSMACERLMHGSPSGVDSSVAVYGGAFRFHQGGRQSRSVPVWPLRFINSGRPAVSTGECVEKVKSLFSASDPIWGEFERVTDGVDGLLGSPFGPQVQDLISENHRLLCRIGVVPERVQMIIRDIEAQGGAAKVCGAGAVAGESAGIIMVAGDYDITDVLNEWKLNVVEHC